MNIPLLVSLAMFAGFDFKSIVLALFILVVIFIHLLVVGLIQRDVAAIKKQVVPPEPKSP